MSEQGQHSSAVWGDWVPMGVRGGQEFGRELQRRIDISAQKYHSEPEGTREVEGLEDLGRQISQARDESGLNPTELSQLAGVDERLLTFATTGLLEPHELTAGNFLAKISHVLGKNLELELDK